MNSKDLNDKNIITFLSPKLPYEAIVMNSNCNKEFFFKRCIMAAITRLVTICDISTISSKRSIKRFNSVSLFYNLIKGIMYSTLQ